MKKLTEYKCKDFNAFTIPADGFEKLVIYNKDNFTWVHKNYRKKPKKNRKKSKKSR